ncbi:Uncharacterized protein APZ42_025565 [Daphnia magna]|uniref:Uncharacterized protein n=1 Tax=Daphnia magna TaxID=35525 RepID=A0A164SY22_9CRUS|nr:Uncharacterized protein APZ42_025565 [Daphnia magna]
MNPEEVSPRAPEREAVAARRRYDNVTGGSCHRCALSTDQITNGQSSGRPTKTNWHLIAAAARHTRTHKVLAA